VIEPRTLLPLHSFQIATAPLTAAAREAILPEEIEGA
jgi:hypothetical protein